MAKLSPKLQTFMTNSTYGGPLAEHEAVFKAFLAKVAADYADEIDPHIIESLTLENFNVSWEGGQLICKDVKVMGKKGYAIFLKFTGEYSLATHTILWHVSYVMHDDPISVGGEYSIAGEPMPKPYKTPPSPLQDLTPIEVLAKQVESFTGILAALDDKVSLLMEQVGEHEALIGTHGEQVAMIKSYLQTSNVQNMQLRELIKNHLNNTTNLLPPY